MNPPKNLVRFRPHLKTPQTHGLASNCTANWEISRFQEHFSAAHFIKHSLAVIVFMFRCGQYYHCGAEFQDIYILFASNTTLPRSRRVGGVGWELTSGQASPVLRESACECVCESVCVYVCMCVFVCVCVCVAVILSLALFSLSLSLSLSPFFSLCLSLSYLICLSN